MTRGLQSMVCLALLVQTAGLAAERPAALRLVEVTSESTAASQSVLITATAPASYTTFQPDPLTLLVTLYDVAAADVASHVRVGPSDPVGSVDVMDGVDNDGTPVARVRIGLRAPTTYEMRARQQTIQVRFPRLARGPTPSSSASTASEGLPPATAILSIDAAVEPDAITVTLQGDGVLSPTRIHEAEFLPPQLLIDFPALATDAAAFTPVELDPVQHVRVERSSPELTRVVFALARSAVYHIEPRAGSERTLRVVFPRDRTTALVAAEPRGPGAQALPPPGVQDPLSVSQVPETAAVSAVARAETVSLLAATVAPEVVLTPRSETLVASGAERPVTPKRTERYLPLTRSSRLTGESPRARRQLPGQSAPTRQDYAGDPISMDFQNSDLRAVLRVFAEISGLNIVIDPSVQGEVNVALTQVPWDQAFDIILRANGLDYEVDGTVVRIASIERLQEEAQARAVLAQREAEAGELVVFTRTLSYARADDLVQLITNTTLSPRGEVFTDPRTNTLIIRDLEDRLTTLSELLDTLDRAEPQVEIAARIVQAGHDSARALGVQWGVTGRVAQDIGNSLPFSFPNRGGITGRVGAPEGQGPSGIDSRALPQENAATAVDLGVGAPNSALGLTLGSVNGALNLDVVLSALESRGELSDHLQPPRDDTEQRAGGDSPRRPDSVSDGREQHGHRPVQGGGPDATSHPADHGGQHRDHAGRAGELLRRLRARTGRPADSIDRHATSGDDDSGWQRRDDCHRWHLRKHPKRTEQPYAGVTPDSAVGLVVQEYRPQRQYRRADDLPHTAHRVAVRTGENHVGL